MTTMAINRHVHTIRTYKLYPRASYFQRRLVDASKRFLRIAGAFPKPFHNDDSYRLIQDHQTLCELSPRVIVIGNQDLPFSRIVVTEEPLKEFNVPKVTLEPGITIYICYVHIEDVDGEGKQILDATLSNFFSEISNHDVEAVNKLIVVCDITRTVEDHTISQFRQYILSSVESIYGDWPFTDRIIIGSDNVSLSSKVSLILESDIIGVFENMVAYFARFMRREQGQRANNAGFLKSHELDQALNMFCLNVENFKDWCKMIKGSADDAEFLTRILSYLVRLIMSSAVPLYSQKYNMPLWLVHCLIQETDFAGKIENAISTRTRETIKDTESCYLIEEINVDVSQQIDMNVEDSSSPIFNETTRHLSRDQRELKTALKSDWFNPTKEVETSFASAESIIAVMFKMNFELQGYIKQTITREKPKDNRPVISDELRKEILSLEKVFGTGIIYGNLEIHVVKLDDDVSDAVDDIIRKHSYTRSYKIQEVLQEPTSFARMQHENGKIIKSKWPKKDGYRSGTLGGFLVDNTASLYAVTCAHVVSGNGHEHDVLIQERWNQWIKLGVSTPRLTIAFGLSTKPLIDIAAVKVDCQIDRHCIRFLKNEDGMHKRAQMETSPFNVGLNHGPFVYKYGATTDFTTGILTSSEFTLSVNQQMGTTYLLLVDCLPDIIKTKFAERGDSGALVCTPSIDNDKIVVLSMVSGGDYKVGDNNDDKCLSFQLSAGIDQLTLSSGIQLDLANMQID